MFWREYPQIATGHWALTNDLFLRFSRPYISNENTFIYTMPYTTVKKHIGVSKLKVERIYAYPIFYLIFIFFLKRSKINSLDWTRIVFTDVETRIWTGQHHKLITSTMKIKLQDKTSQTDILLECVYVLVKVLVGTTVIILINYVPVWDNFT